MKLHLGCGQRYLEGYVNIDFPMSEHSVQEKSIADLHADIRALAYPAGSIDEVRLHHVFEHFQRPVACALVAAWQSWLKPGGLLRIEVPDFDKTSAVLRSRFNSFQQKAVAERHLFGSHEASWAVHYEGYTPVTLRALLNPFRLGNIRVIRNAWRGTYNFEIIAEKLKGALSQDECLRAAKGYLACFLVDESPGELRLLDTWLEMYQNQSRICWAQDA